ncbi:ThiF family adenylyltransferase [Philodulcilactobacillus myokoensis]
MKLLALRKPDEIFKKSPNLVINCADKPFGIDIFFDKASTKYNIPVIFGSYASTTINTVAKIPGKTINISDFLDDNAITNKSMINSEIPTSVIAPATFMVASMVSYYVVMLLTSLRTPTTAIQIDMDGWKVLKYDISKKRS